MTYADDYNLRTRNVTMNNVADAIDGVVSKGTIYDTSGTSSAYVVTPSPAWTSYAVGYEIVIKPHVTCAASATINVSSLGAKTIRYGGADIGAADLVAGRVYRLTYDGTYMQAQWVDRAILEDGTVTPTANLPMGGFKHTGAASANATGQYVTYNQLRDSSFGGYFAVFETNSTSNFQIGGTTYRDDATPAILTLAKSRSTSVGSYAILKNNDIIGRIAFSGANGTNTTDAARIIVEVDGTPGASNDMPGRIIFQTTPDTAGIPVERVRIDNAGRVFVNGMQASLGQFDVTSNAATRRAITAYSAATADLATPAIGAVKWDNNNTSSNRLVQFWIDNGSLASGAIVPNGSNQAQFASTSDARLKENIVDLPSQLTNLMALRPVEFDYKDGSGHQIGFIAQEVQSVYPDLVAEDPDGYLNLTGLGKNEARLIKAFQEFATLTQGKIAALEARIAELEGA